MPKRSKTRLSKFLKRYSTERAGRSVCTLYKQWVVVEVRDVGRRKNLICPCGRTGLRYLCFIRNSQTNVQSYVGSTCIRHFTNQTVPSLLTLLESLAVKGVSCKYMGRAAGGHNFRIRSTCPVVRRRHMLTHFFSTLPIRRTKQGWVMKVRLAKNQHTFHTPRLIPRHRYNIHVGPVTGKETTPRPALIFYADRIRHSGAF